MKKRDLMRYLNEHPLIILTLLTALFFSVVLGFYRDAREDRDICIEEGGVWSLNEARCLAPLEFKSKAIGSP